MVVEKIRSWDGDIITTRDTHSSEYLSTNEGRHLPIKHCIEGTPGHAINEAVSQALASFSGSVRNIDKPAFGSVELPEMIRQADYDSIELIGLCTDICVISNAIILKAYFPEMPISVDPSCCAGVTPESHAAAITTMKMCQIDISNE